MAVARRSATEFGPLEGRGLVRLHLNENALGASPRALAALTEYACSGALSQYPAMDGGPLREAIAATHALSTSQVLLGNGSTELIALIARTALRPGGSAVFVDASFVFYAQAVALAGGEAIAVPEMDADAIVAAARPDTRLVFLAHPGNPCGTRLDARGLERLASALPEDVLLVVDEAYAEYESPETFPSAFELLRKRARLLVLRTFSKIHGLAGLRVGYAAGPAGLVAELDRARTPFNVSAPALAGALSALADLEHVKRSRLHVERAREGFVEEAQRRRLEVRAAHGNFALLAGGRPGKELTAALAGEGVLVQAGPATLERFIRVTLGRDAELARFWTALDAIR